MDINTYFIEKENEFNQDLSVVKDVFQDLFLETNRKCGFNSEWYYLFYIPESGEELHVINKDLEYLIENDGFRGDRRCGDRESYHPNKLNSSTWEMFVQDSEMHDSGDDQADDHAIAYQPDYRWSRSRQYDDIEKKISLFGVDEIKEAEEIVRRNFHYLDSKRIGIRRFDGKILDRWSDEELPEYQRIGEYKFSPNKEIERGFTSPENIEDYPPENNKENLEVYDRYRLRGEDYERLKYDSTKYDHDAMMRKKK